MSTLDLRQPTPSLVLLASSWVVAVVFVVVTTSIAPDASTAVLFVVFAGGICVANTARALSRARTTADGALVVRNWFRTTTVQRADVDRVLTDRAGGPGAPRRVQLLLRDGSTLPLVATETLVPGGRARVEGQAEELRAWVAGG